MTRIHAGKLSEWHQPQRMRVLSMLCPNCGEVGDRTAAIVCPNGWDGTATVGLLRQTVECLFCGEQVLWATEPLEVRA